MVDKVGGRKAAACLTGLVAVVGVYLAKGTLDATMVDAVKFLVSAYLAGNVGADLVDAAKARSTQAEPPAVAADPRIDAVMEGQKITNQSLQFIVAKISGTG